MMYLGQLRASREASQKDESSTLRILWVKAGKLLPVDTGGKIRSYNLLRNLQREHDLTLLTYYFGKEDEAYESEIMSKLPNTLAMEVRSAETSLGESAGYLAGVFRSAPYAVTKFTSPRVGRKVSQWLAEGTFDVAVCDFLSASLNFPARLQTPTVLFQHNVESVLWERQALHEGNPIKRLIFRLEAAKMARYERAALQRFHHIIAVSEKDRIQMAKAVDRDRISVSPTGVDLQQYRFSPLPTPAPQRVLFLGSMDWEANIDAVEYFCQEIWPRVSAEVPGALFQIVGRNPHPRVRKLSGTSVEVTGTVSSVVEYLHGAGVFAVPLRVGGGTRLKIYEAMATGRPVVSTSVGAEGLDVHDGVDILLADTAEKFADCVVRLLKDASLRTRLATAAAQQAARYDWSVIAQQFAGVLSKTVESVAGSPADSVAVRTPV